MGINIETHIYNGLKTILTNNDAVGVDTIIYNGQERIMPCIEIDEINETFNERFSCYDLMNVSFVVRCLTRDNFNFVEGQFDDSDISGDTEGSASIADNVRNEIISDYSTQLTQLINLEHTSTTKIDQDGEITGYELFFEGIFTRSRP